MESLQLLALGKCDSSELHTDYRRYPNLESTVSELQSQCAGLADLQTVESPCREIRDRPVDEECT
ncbi:MAG: hypothetical protein OXG25_09390 [Gammaproteobacteria bacterium]|nr:hypothetical protein [Gammaproteobacteria bacterium]